MREADAIKSDVQDLKQNIEGIEDHLETVEDALDNLPSDTDEIFYGGDLRESGNKAMELADELANSAEELGSELSDDFHFSREAREVAGNLSIVMETLWDLRSSFEEIRVKGETLQSDPSDRRATRNAEDAVEDARKLFDDATSAMVVLIRQFPSQTHLKEQFDEHRAERVSRDSRLDEDI